MRAISPSPFESGNACKQQIRAPSLHHSVSFVEIGGGLLAQAARNQTQGVEERYAKGTTHSSRRKAGLFASTLMAKTVGRPQTSLKTCCVVRMTHFQAGAIPSSYLESLALYLKSLLKISATAVKLSESQALVSCPFFWNIVSKWATSVNRL